MNNFSVGHQTGRIDSVSSSTKAVSNNRDSASQRLSSASSYAELHFLFGSQDPRMDIPKPNRNRRKSTHDHTKHRRVRSGCYTCRSRRIKCDEAHPTCERCKKGGRECVYPEISTTAKPSGRSTSKIGGNVSSSDESEDGGSERLDEMDSITPPSASSGPTKHRSSTSQIVREPKHPTRTPSETPSLTQDKSCASPTPSTESSVGYSVFSAVGWQGNQVTSSTPDSSLRNDWSHLPPDLQFYLTYFYENLTHCHYSLKLDSGNFLRTRFLDAALRNDALLHAVVGFAAFQRTLHNPTGKIQDFLQYYNKSVSLLLNSLRKGEKREIGTLLAILQLATIEEFLGDWINLLGHQKAAYEILTEIYTPRTVMEDEMARVILGWYTRFDVFAGLMAGFETVLSREWFSYAQDFFAQQVQREPQELEWKIEYCLAKQRLIAMDMSLLFARNGKGEMSQEEFIRENDLIGRQIEEWDTQMDPALKDPRYLVTDFSRVRPLDPDDIVNPYLPNTIYYGPLWVMNIARLDWNAIDLLHKYQSSLTLGTQPNNRELSMTAYSVCQVFEAVELFPGSPKGAVLAGQASLGIAALFLPRDKEHSMWSRRKFASIECEGYIYPYTFRTKMADLFRDRSCMQWWLPNNECYPPIVRSIRKFVEERSSQARNGPAQEDLRDMKAIFAALKLDDGTSSFPTTSAGRKASVIDSTFAAIHENQATQDLLADNQQPVERDSFNLGFEDGRGFWGGHQGGGAYGIQRP